MGQGVFGIHSLVRVINKQLAKEINRSRWQRALFTPGVKTIWGADESKHSRLKTPEDRKRFTYPIA